MTVRSETERHGAKDCVRHRVVCDTCGWTSHHYSHRTTAETIFAEHLRRTCTVGVAA